MKMLKVVNIKSLRKEFHKTTQFVFQMCFSQTRFVQTSALIFCILISLNSTSVAEEGEVPDIGSLRAQLQSNRSELNAPAPDSASQEKSPLEKAKTNLDQEEEALMQKLKNVVPKKQSAKELEFLKQNELLAEKYRLEHENPELVKPAPKSEGKIAVVKTKPANEVEKEIQKEKLVPAPELIIEKPAVKPIENAEVEPVKVLNTENVNSELKAKVGELQARLNSKSRELEETRNRLVIAETQVERLSGILEKINGQKLAGYLGTKVSPPSNNTAVSNTMPLNTMPSNTMARAQIPAGNTQVIAPIVNPVSNIKPNEESLVGIVTAPKAHLRTGPSKDDSPLMTVSRGTRLVVETRNDDWYRVITPTGGRAWIATDMLSFNGNPEAGSESALRIRGYEKVLP